jgi:hypothetical protein
VLLPHCALDNRKKLYYRKFYERCIDRGLTMKITVINKTAFILMILIGSILMTGCGLVYTITPTERLERKDAKEFILEKTATEAISAIDIHTSLAEVELLEGDQFYVEIEYLYWEEAPDYSLKDGKLYFDDRGSLPDSYSIEFNINNRIKVYLPKNSEMDYINIEDSSGDVNLSGFVAKDLEVTVSYGDFTLEKAAAWDADISLSSGTSEISDFQAGTMDFTNSYGDAYFTDINNTTPRLPSEAAGKSFKASMSSGDLIIKGIQNNSIDITNSYGDIKITDIASDKAEFDLSSGSCSVSEAKVKSMDIRSTYGDLDLELQGNNQDYSLKLDTSYGKIRVDDILYDEPLTLDKPGTGRIKAELSSGDINIIFTD